MKSNPRVFISYARKDGGKYSHNLREKLEKEGISVWQDLIGMEGGRDWWLQITEAIDAAEYMVVVMTPAALESNVMLKEWRYARQEGVCIYPIKASKTLNFSEMPSWMGDKHFYNLDDEHEWTNFISDLQAKCEIPRVPFMASDIPPDYIHRPNEFKQLIESLLDVKRQDRKANLIALKGAGGFGKTFLATAICHDERIQEAYDDGILWINLGQQDLDLKFIQGKINDLIWVLSGEYPGFSGLEAASNALVDLLADRDILIVIDDVWDSVHLKPFLRGGSRCARLITTRNSDTLPKEAARIIVDEMGETEAINLLTAGLSLDQVKGLADLAKQLGYWPLLLSLVNGNLRERINHLKQSVDDAVHSISTELKQFGVTAMDVHNSQNREKAVEITLNLSLEILSENESGYYQQLAIFPEYENIPFETIGRLWGTSDIAVERLCIRLFGISLLQGIDFENQTIRIHDVVRNYLNRNFSEQLLSIHNKFLDSYEIDKWTNLSEDEPYIWDNLYYHLVSSNRNDELVITVKDFHFLAKKIWLCKIHSLERDLLTAIGYKTEDGYLHTIYKRIRNIGHLLNACGSQKDVYLTLCNSFLFIEEVKDYAKEILNSIQSPYLKFYRKPVKAQNPALFRTLSGHEASVQTLDISPDGRTVVSGALDDAIRIWNIDTGRELRVLEGHDDWINQVLYSQDGMEIVALFEDLFYVWDSNTGELKNSLRFHPGKYEIESISPTFERVVTVDVDHDFFRGVIQSKRYPKNPIIRYIFRLLSKLQQFYRGPQQRIAYPTHTNLRVWDSRKGIEVFKIEVLIKSIIAEFSPDGESIVIPSIENNILVVDSNSGKIHKVLKGHTDSIQAIVFCEDGETIFSDSSDNTLRMWNLENDSVKVINKGEKFDGVLVTVSPDGENIVFAIGDNKLSIWEFEQGVEKYVLENVRTHFLKRETVLAFCRNSKAIATLSSEDNSLILVWDATNGEMINKLEGHTRSVETFAFTPDSSNLISSGDKTLRIWQYDKKYSLDENEDRTGNIDFSPDGTNVVFCSNGDSVKIVDSASGKNIHELKGHNSFVTEVEYSPDGHKIVSGSDDKTLRIWDSQSGKCLYVLNDPKKRTKSLRISPNNQYVVSIFYLSNLLYVWNLSNGEIVHVLENQNTHVRSTVFSPDSKKLATGSLDGKIRLWDLDTGQVVRTFGDYSLPVEILSFSPNGENLLSGQGSFLVIWDINSGEKAHVLEGHNTWIKVASYSPDGGAIISGSEDNTLRIWCADDGQCLHILDMHTDWIKMFSFNTDCRLIVSGSSDDTVRLWNIGNGEYLGGIYLDDNIVDCKWQPNGNLIIVSGSSRDYFLKCVE